MKDLDTTLREIYRACDVSNNRVHALSEDEAIAQIHQAYTDAGYVPPNLGETLYKMPKGKDLARELAGLEQIVDDGVDVIDLPVMMTGQDFYKRFKELSDKAQGQYIGVGNEKEFAEHLARQAAGLEPESTS